MKAFAIHELGPVRDDRRPLVAEERPVPSPGPGEMLIRIAACGVCHTELDEIEGRTPPSSLPRVPGHQVAGQVERIGFGVAADLVGARVGVAWIFGACGQCELCRKGDENLCPAFVATGRDADGGYAELMLARADFVHPLPDALTDVEVAPLLCAGAVGYRSLRLAGLKNGQPLGFTGFGASAHLVLQMARVRYPESPVFVFARGDGERAFARELGAVWTGDIGDRPPQLLAAIVDTTPAWRPVVHALRALAPGGRLVINAIRKESHDRAELLDLDYASDLWREKEVKSVANVTREDVRACLALAAAAGIRPTVTTYTLEDANQALVDLREGEQRGARVLVNERRG
jgi:propanol-preferring alcohol dehydrogenase